MARERKLIILLIMQVDGISDITASGGPKQIIDSYMSGQAAGSSHKYGYEETGGIHLSLAEMSIVVETRVEAAGKMDQIENNLNLLPKIRNLKYWYVEQEQNLNNVPE